MYSQTPKYRKQLNSNQLAILELLYKFRFATRDLIAAYINKKDVYRQLRILEDQYFIAKYHEPSFRLQGKSAFYYLLPEGVRKLNAESTGDRKLAMKPVYKLKTLSEQFMRHNTDILAIRNVMHQRDKTIKFFTRTDLSYEDYDYFPQPLPDAYIRLANGQQCFIQVHHDHQPFFVAMRAIKKYLDYFENGVWDDTGTDFPIVLFVVDTVSIHRRLHKFISKNIGDVRFYTALKNDVVGGDRNVWHCVDEPEKARSINELSTK
jgi:hypothetical protein